MTRRKARVEPSRARFVLLVQEAAAGIMQRPGRAALTALGTTLGIGAFVAVLGITTTANGQITGRFTRLAATEVEVQLTGSGADERRFPDDAERRVGRIDGVEHAAVHWTVDDRSVHRWPPGYRGDDNGYALRILAATPGVWAVSQAPVLQGRVFDAFTATQDVAVLGASVATKLRVADLSARPVVYLGDRPFLVIGIVGTALRVDDVTNAVTIPAAAALDLWGSPETAQHLTIQTRLGAAKVVARQVPVAVDPRHPDRYSAVAAAEPRVLGNRVSADLRSLFLALAGVCLLVGAVGIANANVIAVLERVPEIGIRRSLGAMPRHVGVQFLIESTILGALGGAVGSIVGGSGVLAVSLARHWTPVVAPWTVVAAPGLGALVGLIAGVYPALRAARIEPVEAFRR